MENGIRTLGGDATLVVLLDVIMAVYAVKNVRNNSGDGTYGEKIYHHDQ